MCLRVLVNKKEQRVAKVALDLFTKAIYLGFTTWLYDIAYYTLVG